MTKTNLNNFKTNIHKEADMALDSTTAASIVAEMRGEAA